MKNLSPIILCDSREQLPWKIQAFPVEIGALVAGDYSVRGFHSWENPGFAVERKSVADLVGSLTSGRTRFLAEVERLRRFRFSAIIVEGERSDIESGAYRSAANPNAILQTLAAIEVRAGVHVIFAGSAEGAARMFERLARQFVRGVEKDFRRLQSSAATAAEVTTTAAEAA